MHVSKKYKCVYKWDIPQLPVGHAVSSPNAVVTVCTGERGKMLMDRWGHSIKPYAQKIGADYIEIRESVNPQFVYLDKFVVGRLLDHYERVIYVDADVEILDGALNLFEYVPKEVFGAFDEQLYYQDPAISEAIDRVVAIGEEYGYSFYRPTRYMQAGIHVSSRIHKKFFDPPSIPFVWQACYEQDLLHARVLNSGLPVMYMGPEIQYIHGFGKHEKEHTKFRHYPGVVPYDNGK